MKPAVLLTLSFILFAFPLAFSDDAQPVLDTDGKPVVTGSEYYIRPRIFGPQYPPGVTLGKTGNSACPVTVEVNSTIIDVSGIPVKFSNGEIFTEAPLEIEFAKKPDCVESSKWMIFGDSEIQEACVGIGGPRDNPGQPTLNGMFSILKSSLGYRLVFCVPIVEPSPLCSNIGRHSLDVSLSLLVLTKNEPGFEFVLIKADSYSGIRTVV